MTSSALYRTRITHLRRAPVHHYFEQRGYSWYVDLDDLPRLPALVAAVREIRSRATISRHRVRGVDDTLRHRVDAFLAERGIELPGGTVTALHAGAGARLRLQPDQHLLVP